MNTIKERKKTDTGTGVQMSKYSYHNSLAARDNENTYLNGSPHHNTSIASTLKMPQSRAIIFPSVTENHPASTPRASHQLHSREWSISKG